MISTDSILADGDPPIVAVLHRLCREAAEGDRAVMEVGTGLHIASGERLAATGARLMVSPNTDHEVIACGIAFGLEVMPGFLIPAKRLRPSSPLGAWPRRRRSIRRA